MNQKLVFVIAAVALVAVLSGAGVLYSVVASQVSDAAVGQSSAETRPSETAGQASEERQEAPDFSMTDSTGNTVNLSDFRGKPVVLNFWASWCPPCIEEMPSFEQIYQEYGTQVQFVMLNATDGSRETRETASGFITEEGFTFPVYYDENSEGAIAYQVSGIPQTVLIDENGRIAAIQIGMVTESALRNSVELILSS